MTRKSKREIARDLEELEGDQSGDVHGGPFTADEKAAFGDGVDLDDWGKTEAGRRVLRALVHAGGEP